MSKRRVELVIIDAQNDFCVPAGTYKDVPTGALLVPGAHDDMRRVAAMVKRLTPILDDIHVTLDSHHLLDVAHPMFWKDRSGNPPAPFTIISVSDVESGVWTPRIPSFTTRMLKYVRSLEATKKYALCIWPPHCLIGTSGAAVVPELMESLSGWVSARSATVDFVTKGSNIFTEHYGAFASEVPDPEDPTTQLNTSLIKTMEEADVLLWAGEAATHCVMTSMSQAFNAFGPDSIKKSVLLTDGMSCIPGFEQNFQDFLKEYTSKGMQTSTTVDFMA